MLNMRIKIRGNEIKYTSLVIFRSLENISSNLIIECDDFGLAIGDFIEVTYNESVIFEGYIKKLDKDYLTRVVSVNCADRIHDLVECQQIINFTYIKKSLSYVINDMIKRYDIRLDNKLNSDPIIDFSVAQASSIFSNLKRLSERYSFLMFSDMKDTLTVGTSLEQKDTLTVTEEYNYIEFKEIQDESNLFAIYKGLSQTSKGAIAGWKQSKSNVINEVINSTGVERSRTFLTVESGENLSAKEVKDKLEWLKNINEARAVSYSLVLDNYDFKSFDIGQKIALRLFSIDEDKLISSYRYTAEDRRIELTIVDKDAYLNKPFVDTSNKNISGWGK